MHRRPNDIKFNTRCNYFYKLFDNSYPGEISLVVSIEVTQEKRNFMLHKPLPLKIFLIISSSYYFSGSLNAFTQWVHLNIQNSFHLSVHYAEKLASSQFCIYKIHWPVKGNVHSRYEHLSRRELTDVLKFCFFSLNTYNFYSFHIKLCKWRGTYMDLFKYI